MYEILLILAIIVCVFLVAIVLIQNPKGGGLSSNFSSSSQLMGVQKTGDFLEKGTWMLAIFLMALSLAINVSVKGGTTGAAKPVHNIKAGQTAVPATQANPGVGILPGGAKPAAPSPKKPQ